MSEWAMLVQDRELQKRNALCVLITELQANGNGRQVMRPPPQSELREAERHMCVYNGSAGRGQVTRPPPQSELRKRNATYVFRTEVPANGKRRKQSCDGGRIGRAPLRLSLDVYVSSIPLEY